MSPYKSLLQDQDRSLHAVHVDVTAAGAEGRALRPLGLALGADGMALVGTDDVAGAHFRRPRERAPVDGQGDVYRVGPLGHGAESPLGIGRGRGHIHGQARARGLGGAAGEQQHGGEGWEADPKHLYMSQGV